MISNTDMKHSEFVVLQDFILVEPKQLDKGELVEDGVIVAMEQNTSIVDRPTTGTVLQVGPDVNIIDTDRVILWPEQDGQDIEFSDGVFLLLKESSVLGYKK